MSQIETEKTDIPANRKRKESTSEEEEIQSDKTKRFQNNNLVRNKYLLNFKKWPIFTLLEEEILLRIDLALIYNDGALIVTRDKMTYAIGNNKTHRLGIPERYNISWPKKVEILCNKNIKKFTYGYYMFVLTEEGEVYSWDYKVQCAFYEGYNATLIEPIKLELKKKHIIDIACNETDFLVLTDDGKVYIYSRCDILYLHPLRQLISSSESESESIKSSSCSETQIPYIIKEENFGQNKIVCIACGTSFIMAITDMGELYSRGFHSSACSNYMLNDDSNNMVYRDLCEHQRFTEKHTELSNVVMVKVVCGYAHALALSNEGQVYIFKQYNCFNVLNIPELQKVLDIAAVYHSDRSAILGDNGHIYVWGNYFGCDIESISPMVTQFSTLQEALMHDIDTYPIILSMNELGYVDVQSNILKCSQTLFDDPSTSDFTIQVKNHSIYVHKAILRNRSEYFESMFHNFKEKDQSILTLPPAYSYTTYKAFLKYLYTGVIDLPLHKLLKLFKLAMMLCDSKLINSCIREIKRKVTLANIIFVYSTAMEYNNENLKKFSIKFAANYMSPTTQVESDNKIDENILESFKKEVANAKELLDDL